MPIDNQTLLRLIKDVGDIRAALRHVTSNLPLFDIANENTPAMLLADENDYAPGNFDVLRLDAISNVSITGISGGKKGRFLEIINISAFKITLPHESLSSAAANRFTVVGSENVVLFPTSRVRLYYDSTLQRWQIPDRPTWQGTYGVSFGAAYGGAAQSIPNSTTTPIIDWLVYTDEWNMFDAVAQKIVIPFTGVYVGVLSGSFSINATGYRMVSWEKAGVQIVAQSYPAVIDAQLTLLSCPLAYAFTAGDEIIVNATQKSGGALDFNAQQWFLTRIG